MSVMPISKKRAAIFIIIFLSLFAAFLPAVISTNYLRQDDLIIWQIWPGMKLSDADYFYYNCIFQLVRPLSLLTFYLTDLISINIHNAVYVRVFSIILLGMMGILLYIWQLRFNTNRVLAATFAISAFTLPSYQLFVATQNYCLILVGLLMAFGAMFYWYASYYETNIKKKNIYFWLGNLLFLCSLLEYPLSSMYAWVLLSIQYLNICATRDFAEKRKFTCFAGLTTAVMMVFYFIGIKYVHSIFHVDLSSRSSVVNTSHLIPRLFRIFDMMTRHSNMWLWKNTSNWKNSPIIPLVFLFATSLAIVYWKQGLRSKLEISKNMGLTIGVTFAFIFLAFSPVMASADSPVTFRYCLATMPNLLYVAFWTMDVLIANIILYPLLISITLFGIGYSNLMIGDGIIGPHEKEFAFMQQQLNEKVIPLIKQNKQVALHLIDCTNGQTPAPNVPDALEYSLRVCSEFQQEAISVVTHSLNLYGYPSNYKRLNKIIWNKDEIIVNDIPWGAIIVNNVEDPHLDQLQFADNEKPTLVTIDMRDEPIYQHMEYYKRLLGMKV